jgi:hypothetical protein
VIDPDLLERFQLLERQIAALREETKRELDTLVADVGALKLLLKKTADRRPLGGETSGADRSDTP